MAMRKLESVLVATDFSTDAQNAVTRAALICKTVGISRGLVLHVLESSWLDILRHFGSKPEAMEQSAMADALQSLVTLTSEIQGFSGCALEPMVRTGKPLDTIMAVSADYDLLVLGARGTHSFREVAVGTTAERILRQIHKLMLVVRREAGVPYRRVLVAVDFSDHSRTALGSGIAIAPGAEIHVAHIFEAPFERKMSYAAVPEKTISEYRMKARREAEAELERFIKNAGIDNKNLHHIIEHGDHVPSVLRNKAVEIGADLVVVGRHGRSLAEHLLLGSVTIHLLAECPCDVLVTQ